LCTGVWQKTNKKEVGHTPLPPRKKTKKPQNVEEHETKPTGKKEKKFPLTRPVHGNARKKGEYIDKKRVQTWGGVKKARWRRRGS